MEFGWWVGGPHGRVRAPGEEGNWPWQSPSQAPPSLTLTCLAFSWGERNSTTNQRFNLWRKTRLGYLSHSLNSFPWIHRHPYTKHWGERHSSPWWPWPRVNWPLTPPWPQQAEGEILWCHWPLAVSSLFHAPFWSSLFQLKGHPGLSKSRPWLILSGEAIWK